MSKSPVAKSTSAKTTAQSKNSSVMVNKKPTEAELELLSTLWRIGPATVKQLHQAVNEVRPSGYTTVLKILQIMHGKGLVQRDESNRAHVYAPEISAHHTQAQLLRDLIDKAFAGSTKQLILQAIAQVQSAAEMAEIIQTLQKEYA